MALFATMEELIEWGKSQEISHRNLSKEAYITYGNTGETIEIPLNQLMSEYRHFLKPYIITVTINDEELYKYQYKPKSLSQVLYGTTEYWSVLLMINNCVSKIDFDMNPVKVLDPKRIRAFTNEVLILEKVIE